MVDEQVSADFDRALRKAFRRDLRGFFLRQPNRLLSFHDVQQRLSIDNQRYRGMQTVPIDSIVGSFDRYRDFDGAFLPRRRHTAQRWKNIDRAHHQDIVLPPVHLYKLGDIYFVKDGNHRVSVARERGVEFIDAEVVEATIRAPLDASMSPERILIQIEYAEFLRRTNLDRLRPEHDLRPSALGRYDEMLEHIDEYETLLGELGDEPAGKLAVVRWYDEVYLPIVRALRKRQILKRFPGRSEADGYLWVMARRDVLAGGPRQMVDAEAASRAYVQETHPLGTLVQPIRIATKAARRSVDWATRTAQGRDDQDETGSPEGQ